MRFFWRWVAATLLVAGLVYAALVALSGAVLPPQRHFDTDVATTSEPWWTNEMRYLVLNAGYFARPGDRVVILGASNARGAFRPALIARGLPGRDIANAGVGGANVGEIADIVDVIRARQPRDHGPTTYVIGSCYLLFERDARLWGGGTSPVAVEAMRAGLYARTREGRLAPRYPAWIDAAVVAALKPQAVVAHVPRAVGDAVLDNPALPRLKALGDRLRGQDPLAQWTRFLGQTPDLNTVEVPPSTRRALLAQRVAGMGGDHVLAPEQFVALDRLIRRVRAAGDRIVIADLPLPDWHLAGVPQAQASYVRGLAAVRHRHAGDRGVGYLSLADLGAAANFYDSAHAKPALWPVWSARLARHLRE